MRDGRSIWKMNGRSKQYQEALCYNRSFHQLITGPLQLSDFWIFSFSEAASAIVGKRTNGWWFFLTDQASRSLQRVRRDYVNTMAVDVEDDEPEDDGDDE
jgi:hypothetical protein